MAFKNTHANNQYWAILMCSFYICIEFSYLQYDNQVSNLVTYLASLEWTKHVNTNYIN